MIGPALAKRTAALLLGACIGLAAAGAMPSTQPAQAPRTLTGTPPRPPPENARSLKESGRPRAG